MGGNGFGSFATQAEGSEQCAKSRLAAEGILSKVPQSVKSDKSAVNRSDTGCLLLRNCTILE